MGVPDEWPSRKECWPTLGMPVLGYLPDRTRLTGQLAIYFRELAVAQTLLDEAIRHRRNSDQAPIGL